MFDWARLFVTVSGLVIFQIPRVSSTHLQIVMGSSASRPSPLAPTFERMASWDIKAAKKLLADYKEKDLDFGLDAQALAELCGGDNVHAEAIIDAFGGTNGIVNALAYICGAILVSSGAAVEKAGLVFDALDFDMTEQITMDEMTIALLCCARGFCVMSATGSVPSDEALESVTLQAYRELSKSGGHSISKAEFTKWVVKHIATAPTAVAHAEVSLDDMAVQFGLVAAPPAKSLADEVLSELAAENNNVGSEVVRQEEIAAVEAEALAADEPKEAASGVYPTEQNDEIRAAEDAPCVEATEGTVNADQPPVEDQREEVAQDVEAIRPVEAAGEPVEVGQSHDPDYTDEFQAETPRVDDREQPAASALVEPLEPTVDAEAPTDGNAAGSGTVEGDESLKESPIVSDATVAPASGELKSNGEAADEEAPASDAPWDLNAYDTYDYTDAAYDANSGLPPPDPFEDMPDEPVPGQEGGEEVAPVVVANEATPRADETGPVA